MTVCAQTSACPTCGQFETTNVSLCACPPRRLADQVDILTQRLQVQSDTIASQQETIGSLSRQLQRLTRRVEDLEAAERAHNARLVAVEARSGQVSNR